MYASLISLSALMVAAVSAALVPQARLGNTDFTTCKTQLTQSMANLDPCKFFNGTWYIAAYDNTWLHDIMNMDGMSCMNYQASCYSDNSVNTTINFGMGNPTILNYNKPPDATKNLWWTQDMQNVLAVLDTDYFNYGVIAGCNNKTGLFWNVLSRGLLPNEGLAWSVLKNKDLVGGTAQFNLDDSNSKLTDNSGCGNPPNGAAQVTAMSGMVVSMLAVMSAWIMS